MPIWAGCSTRSNAAGLCLSQRWRQVSQVSLPAGLKTPTILPKRRIPAASAAYRAAARLKSGVEQRKGAAPASWQCGAPSVPQVPVHAEIAYTRVYNDLARFAPSTSTGRRQQQPAVDAQHLRAAHLLLAKFRTPECACRGACVRCPGLRMLARFAGCPPRVAHHLSAWWLSAPRHRQKHRRHRCGAPGAGRQNQAHVASGSRVAPIPS
jgi:hypothetical protein